MNCCTIDWFSSWNDEALATVAAKFMSDVDLHSHMDEATAGTVRSGIISTCKTIHKSIETACDTFYTRYSRRYYTTPTPYLELLKLFKSILNNKRQSNHEMEERLNTGLDKLNSTTHEVITLQKQLGEMQPLLKQAAHETETSMLQIQQDKATAEETRIIVIREEGVAAKKAQETKAIAEDAQSDLEQAMPALMEATELLQQLNRNDIIEVRHFQRPPEGVKIVMEAVCIMLGEKPKKIVDPASGKKTDDYWEASKAVLGDPNFMKRLLEFNRDSMYIFNNVIC